jgi:outer membrane protein OmpA-like peptidoglycan-associated protein
MSLGRSMLILCGGLALSACGDAQPLNSWTHEAGAFLNEGGFGSAVAANSAMQAGERGYVVNLNNRFVAEVPTMVNFAFDSTVLDATAQAILNQQANWIRQFPEIRFRVYGHTDLVGSTAYNKGLGLRRAQAVVAYLVSHGISRSRLEAVVSFGETQPLIVTQGRERRNRRTVTEVSGFVGATSKQLLDGKYAAAIYREYIASATESSSKTEAGSANGGQGQSGGGQ